MKPLRLAPEKLIAGMNEVVQANAEPAALKTASSSASKLTSTAAIPSFACPLAGAATLEQWLRQEFRS